MEMAMTMRDWREAYPLPDSDDELIDNVEYKPNRGWPYLQWTAYLKQGHLVKAIGFGATKTEAMRDGYRLFHLWRTHY